MNLILITSLLYLLINVSLASSSMGVYFNYNSTTGWKDVKFYGDTTIYNHILQLTGPKDECGWATYSTSIPLVDGVTGEPASFLTHFSFFINGSSLLGYGFAFFLSPNVWPSSSCSGDLGLFPEHDYTGSSQNQVVAVEFDTHKDAWDPDFYHVGIDVNNIYSVVVHKYSKEVIIANVVHAWVSYSAGEQMLNVSLNFQGDSESPGDPILSYKLNLTQVLPTTVTVGFSAANYYTDYNESHQILSWEFNSTFGSNTIPPPQKPKSGPQVYIVVLCTIAVMVILGGTGLVLVWLKNSLIKKREDRPELPKKYSYKELVVATSNFAEKNKLGEGGFGPVFKGYLRDSCDEVAVKHLKQGSTQGSKEFKSEVEILSNLRHPNLVEFFGWSEENGQLLLVYKYMPNGSLNSPLFDKHRLLLWIKRYEIVLDLTDALCYLQIDNECNKEVVHRDIKPENVLLDSSLHAKLSDFGLARLVDHGLNAKTTSAAGSWGYVAPELFSDDGKSKPSTQSEIYSFGIVLLEIACGRRPIDLDLTRFVWEHYERKELLKAADERLKGEYSAKEIECVLFVGLWCVHPVASDRPDIGLARKALKFQECKLPVLPNYPRLFSERVIGRRSTTELSSTTGTSMWSSEEV